MESKEEPRNVNIVVSEASEMFLKVNPKKPMVITEPKFRSFTIPVNNGELVLNNRCKVSIYYLKELIEANGGNSTVPIHVSLTTPISFVNFDWEPHNCANNKQIIDFTWKEIKCSLTGRNTTAVYLRVHDCTKGVAIKVLNEIRDELLKNWKEPIVNGTIQVFTPISTNSGFQWQQSIVRPQRPMNTIYIPQHLKNEIIAKISKFNNNSSLYDKFGVTWKYINLFHGPPGTGKTSMIAAIASYFNQHIAKMTITPEMTGHDLEKLFRTLPQNTYLVIEDVDALFAAREAKTNIDFSTMLNCMDGFTTRRGLIAFMTTNHISKLDAAFLRPGRIDNNILFDFPQRSDILEALNILACDYKHEHEIFIEHNQSMSIANIQKHLFDCIMNEAKSILIKPVW